MPGGDSLPRLLQRERGVRNIHALSPLTEALIVRWARKHHRRTGRWPSLLSGPVEDAPGESWRKIDHALVRGYRGLPGGDSLSQFLARRLGVYNRHSTQRLTEEMILAWADAHKARTGAWPTAASGFVPDAPGEMWRRINVGLRLGLRGLRGGSSLPTLLAEKRGGPNRSRGR